MDRYLKATNYQLMQTENATEGTGDAEIVDTAYDPTKGLLVLRNKTGSKHVTVPRRLDLICSAAPTGDTDLHFAVEIDPIGANSRWNAGGAAYTPINHVMTSDGHRLIPVSAPESQVHFGALTLNAAGANKRRLWAQKLKTSISAVGDTYAIDFDEFRVGGIWAGPVILQPTDEMIIHVWATSESGAGSWQHRLMIKEIPVVG